MSRQDRLHEAFSTHFFPSHLIIQNETSQHHVPADSESHFKVLIVSAQFHSLNRVARTRLVNQLILNEFSTGLHALSLHLYTEEEWEQKQSTLPPSPVCRGGASTELK